jgi:hypothetical protein
MTDSLSQTIRQGRMMVDPVHDGSRLFTMGNVNQESSLLLKRLQGS